MTENNPKQKSWWRHHISSTVSTVKTNPYLSCFVTAVFLNLFIELWNQQSLIKLMHYVFVNPLVFLYNTLLLFVPVSLCLFFRRQKFFHILITAILAILGVTNGIVLICRVTPFGATDIKLANLGLGLVTMYLKWWMIAAILAALILLIIGLVIIFKKSGKQELPFSRIKMLLILAVMIFSVSSLTQLGCMTGLLPSQFSNLREAYQTYGMPYCFSCSVINTGIQKPSGYTTDEVDQIVEDVDKSINQSTASNKREPNIIMLQLETFFDVTQLKELSFNKDPIPNYHALMRQFTSGWLSVPVVGAGTANSEFEVLTGMNLDFFGPGEYPYKTVLQSNTCESLAYDLKDIGYSAHVIHNNTATFYDRNLVFSNLGFDTFTSIEYMNHLTYTATGWAKDKVLTSQIKDALDSTDGQDFVYTISVQGHGAYPENEVLQSPEITVSGLDSESKTYQYTYYVNQLHEMDKFVLELTQMLKERGEPTILVMFGDHLPTLGIENEDLKSTDIFQTPYVIWDNMGLRKKDRNIEAFQLGAYALDMVDIHEGIIPKFHQSYFGKDMSALADTINTGDTAEKTNEDIYLDNLKTLEYDMLYGEHATTSGAVPYKPTKIQYGVKPITIQTAAYSENRLYVVGSNFTTSSKVYNGDTSLNTEYVAQWLLIANAENLKVGDELNLTVAQYCENGGVILSESNEYPLTITEEEQEFKLEDIMQDPYYNTQSDKND